MLQRQAALARHVQSLTIRLEDHSSVSDGGRNWARRRVLTEACEEVRNVVSSFVLEGLQMFSWDNDELPPDDGLWVTLRFWCVISSMKYALHSSLTARLFLQLPAAEIHQDVYWLDVPFSL